MRSTPSVFLRVFFPAPIPSTIVIPKQQLKQHCRHFGLAPLAPPYPPRRTGAYKQYPSSSGARRRFGVRSSRSTAQFSFFIFHFSFFIYSRQTNVGIKKTERGTERSHMRNQNSTTEPSPKAVGERWRVLALVACWFPTRDENKSGKNRSQSV